MRRFWTVMISLAILGGMPLWAQDAGWIGVNIADQKDRGARIVDVQSNSPAAQAGLKTDDVILEFNGQPVTGVLQLSRLVRETPAGRSVAIRYERENRTGTAQLTIGKAPSTGGIRFETPAASTFRLPDFGAIRDTLTMDFPDIHASMAATQYGMRIDSMTPQLREYFGASSSEGVLVSYVDPRSAAGVAGLKVGDVIVAVNGKRALAPMEVLRELGSSQTVTFKVLRERQSHEIRFETRTAGSVKPGSSLQIIPNNNGI